MNDILFRQLLMESEGTRLDIKRQQYSFVSSDERKKSALLKDLLAFANAWRSESAYILIGVGEGRAGERDLPGILPTDHIDDANLQQFVNSKLNKPLTFSYRPFTYEGKTFGVFEVPVQERPFCANRDFGLVKKDVVYYRLGSSCAEATPGQVAQMGRDDGARATASPILEVQFADVETGELRGRELCVPTTNHALHDPKSIPDHRDPPPPPGPELFPGYRIRLPTGYDSITGRRAREDFWRELADYIRDHRRFAPILIGVRNSSSSMASHVRVEIRLSREEAEVREEHQLPDYPDSHYNLLDVSTRIRPSSAPPPPPGEISVARRGDAWELVAEPAPLRPRETAVAPWPIYIACEGSCVLELAVTCYAAELSEPIRSTLHVRVVVEQLPELTLPDVERLYHEHLEERLRQAGLFEEHDDLKTKD